MRLRHVLGAGLAIVVAGMAGNAMAQSEIKIGEINSYSLLPAFTEPYRKGWQLAVEEINAAGGINGKKLAVISKDDGGKPLHVPLASFQLHAGGDAGGRSRQATGQALGDDCAEL